MSTPNKTGVPRFIGKVPITGRYYAAECNRCGWVGSSEELTQDAQCARIAGDRMCLGDIDEIGTDHLLGIIQSMARSALQVASAGSVMVPNIGVKDLDRAVTSAVGDEIRDARDYAIEHAGYLADAAEQVVADYQAYALAQMLKSEGGDDGDGELEHAVDSARDELHEGLANLRSMTYEFRKRSSHAGHAVSEEPGAPADLDPRECRKCGSLTADECKAVGCWFERNPSEKACGYSIGDWECRPGGFLYDAGTGEGYDPQDCSHICPCCRTKDYLEAAKGDAESTSKYSNNFDSGTGLDIWKSAEREALKANHPAAVKVLAEIGPVEALDDGTVVICNSECAPVGEVKP